MPLLLLGCLLLKSHPHIQYQRAVVAFDAGVGVVEVLGMPLKARHQVIQLQVNGKQRETEM